MRPALGLLAAVPLMLVAACGDGSNDTSDDVVVITLEADLGEVEPGDLQSAPLLDATAGVLRRRAQAYGLDTPEIGVDGNVFTITASGVSREAALELFGRRGILEFRQPVVSPEGLVGCATRDGEQFAVPAENVNPDQASGSLARCFSRDKLGTPIWAPAGTDEGELTAESVEAGSWEVREDPLGLAARFTPAGAAVLESVTEQLVGYPLGIFLDQELIAAPKIRRALTNGTAFISGFGLERARILAAVLNSGPLTVELAPSDTTPTPVASTPNG